ncbi:MAG: PEGA domain-containing protein [bacterium]|nr:PEGA domain-containing protein [bacterium]
MIKRTRTILFLTCFLIFILLAPSAVLYSQGYRIDLENKKLTQTGGLFIKATPKQADIYVNGKLEKKTDFFFGSALVENLLPKNYKIEIKKEGYHSWEKTLEIKEKQVQDAREVILFPKNINLNVLSDQTEEFWFSPNQRKIITLEEEKQGWALKLYDLDKNIKSQLLAETDIFAEGSELVNLTFSEDSKNINLETAIREKIRYFTLEIDKVSPIPMEITPPEPITLTQQGDEDKSSSSPLAFARVNNDIYYLDETGHLFKNETELTSNPFPVKQESEENKLSSSPFASARETEYALNIFHNYIFLQETDVLYKFNDESKSFDIFFEKIKSLKASPDNKKLAYFSEHEIWVLFLEDKNNPPQKKSGEKILLTRLSETITDAFWLNDNYLIFAAGDVIKISEVDDRDKLNIVDIVEIKKLPQNGSFNKIFWNQSDKKLYILKEKTLYSSDVLLP